MKLAVIGSKKFNNFQLLTSEIEKENNLTKIISGAAPGTDSLARRYAIQNNIPLLEFPPDYAKNGAEAKHVRDRQIVDHSEKVLAFWDGVCQGTKYTMNYARQQNVPVRVVWVGKEISNSQKSI
ncbi:MAG: SLOG family protein [Candidatus Cloacimonadota bacterium]|nr:SLOG family protein [Candidatus Cloacimonadota bacterium]